MIEQIKKTLTRYAMFEVGERVVVGVSGGSDSVCLLHVLKQLNLQFCIDIHVAHFDHGLRKSSSRDRIFVEKLAYSLNVPFFWDRLDSVKLKKSASLEDQLRRHRYDFLSKVCGKIGCRKIVLGHTQDDQAETVLMRILRGSGLYGLSAILPKRFLGSLAVVRPLIEVSRVEIMRYLNRKKITYRVDSTNSKEIFFRNKIRLNLLPLLERSYNPNIKSVLSDLALNVGADYHYLCAQTEGLLWKNLKKGPGGFFVDLKFLKKLDISIRRLFLRMSIELLKGDLRTLTFRHWQEIEDLLFLKPLGAEIHLPGNIVLAATGNRLAIFKR